MGETEKTSVTTDISTNCVNCVVSGGIRALFDGNPSTKFVLEATSEEDIKYSNIYINVDVRYNTRKTLLNHLSITSGDNESFHPSEIRIMAKDKVGDPWTPIHKESTLWAGNDVKKQIVFNNPNSFLEYRLMFMKKANSKKLEISDCDIINRIISSLTAETYYKITNTMLFSPSTVQPKRGFVIGMINYPSKNFIISVNITPLGTISQNPTYIYSFKDYPSSINRQPGLFLNKNIIYSWLMVSPRSIYLSTPPISLAENVEYTVATKVLGDDITLYVDGQVIATETFYYADRVDFSKLYAFVSDNGDAPANVVVKGLRFINLKN